MRTTTNTTEDESMRMSIMTARGGRMSPALGFDFLLVVEEDEVSEVIPIGEG
jgi:hypothetical protein